MKKRFLAPVIYFIVTIAASCTFFAPTAEMQNSRVEESALFLTLVLDNQVYRKTDTINATLFLANQGENEFFVNSRMALNNPLSSEMVRDIAIFIKKPTNFNAEFKVKISIVPMKDDFYTPLHPGMAIHKRFNLADFFSLEETGIYSVFAVYENQFDKNSNYPTWKGKIESNEVIFEIK